jgi:hypothetical protein
MLLVCNTHCETHAIHHVHTGTVHLLLLLQALQG